MPRIPKQRGRARGSAEAFFGYGLHQVMGGERDDVLQMRIRRSQTSFIGRRADGGCHACNSANQVRSKTAAILWPSPMHIVTERIPTLDASNSCTALTVISAPVAPDRMTH